mgnify:CR=1 FL=1
MNRVIEDRRADLTGRFEGEAAWTPDNVGLIQDETGMMHYGAAAPMRATRRYLWRDANGLEVFFDDGRAFHLVPEPGAEAVHDCPPDTYRVRYEVLSPDQFRSTWHVTGPRKDATLTSFFERR